MAKNKFKNTGSTASSDSPVPSPKNKLNLSVSNSGNHKRQNSKNIFKFNTVSVCFVLF